MAIKRHHGTVFTGGGRRVNDPADDVTVPTMHTVIDPDCDDRTRIWPRADVDAVKDEHDV